MKIIFNEFIKQTNKVDKFIIILVFLFPLSLSISIFLSDLFASIMAIFVLFLVIGKKIESIFYKLKNLFICF